MCQLYLSWRHRMQGRICRKKVKWQMNPAILNSNNSKSLQNSRNRPIVIMHTIWLPTKARSCNSNNKLPNITLHSIKQQLLLLSIINSNPRLVAYWVHSFVSRKQVISKAVTMPLAVSKMVIGGALNRLVWQWLATLLTDSLQLSSKRNYQLPLCPLSRTKSLLKSFESM